MDTIVEFLNESGRLWWDHARGMAWQVALVVGVLWGLDRLLVTKVSARWRHALWVLLLIKLLLPSDLAFPTSPAYFVRPAGPAKTASSDGSWRVTLGGQPAQTEAASMYSTFTGQGKDRRRPRLSWVGVLFVVWLSGSAGLLVYVFRQARQWRRSLRHADTGDARSKVMLVSAAQGLGLQRVPGLVVHELAEGPVVWGLARPAIVLPRWLVSKLDDRQLRDVLLHELCHVKRWDLWWNHLQTLLQILYWWHPLVWFGNARMRRVREEATDEAAVRARGGEPDSYAETLVEVARAAIRRPLLTLGLLGILESRKALRTRIERLASGSFERSGWREGWWAVAGLVLAGMLLPMSPGPARATAVGDAASTSKLPETVDVWTAQAKNGVPAITVSANTWNPLEVPGTNVGVARLNEDLERGFLRGKSGVGLEPPDRPGARQQVPLQSAVLFGGQTTFELAPIKVSVLDREPRYRLGEKPSTLQDIREYVRGLKAVHEKVPLEVHVESGVPSGAVEMLLEAVRREGGVAIFAKAGADASREMIKMMAKLEAIRVSGFAARDEPLSNVVRRLVQMARAADPEGTGVNMILDRAVTEGQPVWDEEKRVWRHDTFIALPGPDAVQVTIDPGLGETTLSGVIQAIVKGAASPLTYLVQDYGVTFRIPPAQPKLLTRTYRIHRDAIEQAVGQAKGETRDGAWIQERLREVLAPSGVRFAPPNAVYYNDTRGLLMLRATAEEVDAVEQIIERINTVPAMVQVEAKVLEISSDAENGLGLDAILGGAADGDGAARRGLLTQPQVRVFLKACEQRPVVISAAPRVITLDGRQAAVEMNNKPAGDSPVELGSVAIDVVPRVVEEKSTLELTVLARITALVSMKRSPNGKPEEPAPGVVYAANATGYINLTDQARVRLHDGQSMILAFEPVRSNLTVGGGTGDAKRYVMLITPTLIDPAGNRVNTPGKESFDPNRIPKQPEIKGASSGSAAE